MPQARFHATKRRAKTVPAKWRHQTKLPIVEWNPRDSFEPEPIAAYAEIFARFPKPRSYVWRGKIPKAVQPESMTLFEGSSNEIPHQYRQAEE